VRGGLLLGEGDDRRIQTSSPTRQIFGAEPSALEELIARS
jgi:hypothetical protein